MDMRIQLWRQGKPRELSVNDEYISVQDNAHLASVLERMIKNFSQIHGADSLVQDDVTIHINVVKP